jgi:NAD(P)-dependent dehydrogenase (short-subunit alcohol dehydrogenase family)
MSEIKAAGIKGQLSTLPLDVTDENSITEAAALVEKQFGRLDVLVNNAAIGSLDPSVKVRFQASMITNVVGPAIVAEVFRPLLLKSSNPYSIYVSSSVGSMTLAADPTSPTYRGLANGEAYRASKAALNMVALQESIVFSETPLKIFALCPGFVRSNLRGTSEEARSGWGRAGDPEVSGTLILSVIQGKRDADVGKLIATDGVRAW